jgi:hypothetical protein
MLWTLRASSPPADGPATVARGGGGRATAQHTRHYVLVCVVGGVNTTYNGGAWAGRPPTRHYVLVCVGGLNTTYNGGAWAGRPPTHTLCRPLTPPAAYVTTFGGAHKVGRLRDYGACAPSGHFVSGQRV